MCSYPDVFLPRCVAADEELREGKRAKARRPPAVIYGWFTMRFQAPDRKELKILLEDPP
jgi:hypothetical protein